MDTNELKMPQLRLFEEPVVHKAPNVASVPQYSPLRYPGGKTWFYPFAKRWLLHFRKQVLIEPFAGGGSVGLAAAIEGMVDHVVMVEKDPDVAAFWKTIVGSNAEWLCERIVNFELIPDRIDEALEKKEHSQRDRAFALVLCNRINHGGILANGSGRIANGENGKGIRSRWYPATLKKRIKLISQAQKRIEIIEGDGLEFMREFQNDPNALFFIDPPYTKAGKRLYTHFEVDHQRVFQRADACAGEVMLTYDYADEIMDYANIYGFLTDKILMKTTHHLKKYELMISKNFSWL